MIGTGRGLIGLIRPKLCKIIYLLARGYCKGISTGRRSKSGDFERLVFAADECWRPCVCVCVCLEESITSSSYDKFPKNLDRAHPDSSDAHQFGVESLTVCN